MRRVFIVSALRTPIGRLGGKLASTRIDDLLAKVIQALTQSTNNGFDLALIDDVIIGCANQVYILCRF